MKAVIGRSGDLILIPEGETEIYAAEQWVDKQPVQAVLPAVRPPPGSDYQPHGIVKVSYEDVPRREPLCARPTPPMLADGKQ